MKRTGKMKIKDKLRQRHDLALPWGADRGCGAESVGPELPAIRRLASRARRGVVFSEPFRVKAKSLVDEAVRAVNEGLRWRQGYSSDFI